MSYVSITQLQQSSAHFSHYLQYPFKNALKCYTQFGVRSPIPSIFPLTREPRFEIALSTNDIQSVSANCS